MTILIKNSSVCADVDALELVLNHGGTTKSADVHGGYAIHYAAQMCGNGMCRSGDARVVGVRVLQLLLSFGADVHVTDKHGRQPILWAASAGKGFQRPLNFERYNMFSRDFNTWHDNDRLSIVVYSWYTREYVLYNSK